MRRIVHVPAVTNRQNPFFTVTAPADVLLTLHTGGGCMPTMMYLKLKFELKFRTK